MGKKEIKEFEIVEKLKKLWEKNEGKIKMKCFDETFSFFSSLPLPVIPPSFLERISNKFLKEFNWKKFEKRIEIEIDLGLFLSAFLKKNIEKYILSQKEKGIKEENIKPIEVHLKVKELPIRLWCLGYRNPKKLHLIIEGDCGRVVGFEMQGGEVIVRGNCGRGPGWGMQGGKIVVEGNCGSLTGMWMEDGELNIKGKVKSFDASAFSPDNKGTIIWKTKIWENGNWTKEGKKMRKRGKILVW